MSPLFGSKEGEIRSGGRNRTPEIGPGHNVSLHRVLCPLSATPTSVDLDDGFLHDGIGRLKGTPQPYSSPTPLLVGLKSKDRVGD